MYTYIYIYEYIYAYHCNMFIYIYTFTPTYYHIYVYIHKYAYYCFYIYIYILLLLYFFKFIYIYKWIISHSSHYVSYIIYALSGSDCWWMKKPSKSWPSAPTGAPRSWIFQENGGCCRKQKRICSWIVDGIFDGIFDGIWRCRNLKSTKIYSKRLKKMV